MCCFRVRRLLRVVCCAFFIYINMCALSVACCVLRALCVVCCLSFVVLLLVRVLFVVWGLVFCDKGLLVVLYCVLFVVCCLFRGVR